MKHPCHYLPPRPGLAERIEGEIKGRLVATAEYDADSERWDRETVEAPGCHRRIPSVLWIDTVFRWMRGMGCKIVVTASFDD